MHSSVSFEQVPQVGKRHRFVTPNARSYGDKDLGEVMGKKCYWLLVTAWQKMPSPFGFSLGACGESLGGLGAAVGMDWCVREGPVEQPAGMPSCLVCCVPCGTSSLRCWP